MTRRFLLILLACATTLIAVCEVHISIEDPETWTTDALAAYVGQTVVFDDPLIVCSTRNGLLVSPRRIFAPTNQALPSTTDYDNVVRLNGVCRMSLSGAPGSHRTGEKIYDLCVTVSGKSTLRWVSGRFAGNSREDLQNGPDMRIIDARGQHSLLVCAMNLEYYLSEQFDANSSMGPNDGAQHTKQTQKTIAALKAINADIYGLVEIQRGDGALKEIAGLLNAELPQRRYVIVPSGSTASGTYTQSAYIYDSLVVQRVGARYDIDNSGAKGRKKMQMFREKSSGESFIYSLNHYKAKSGTGSGLDANQGDGQGQFNNTRRQESAAILSYYKRLRTQVGDSDILIMGDLNAYGKEDPITDLTSDGMTDLHRYFHADSSYSYTFADAAGYLDHALTSETLLPQVTGMMAYHINSDEDDRYTYDGAWSDETMFRSSDHDPVLVGLRLDKTARIGAIDFNPWEVFIEGKTIRIHNVHSIEGRAYYKLLNCNGWVYCEGEVSKEQEDYEVDAQPLDSGIYMLLLYANNRVQVQKFIIR